MSDRGVLDALICPQCTAPLAAPPALGTAALLCGGCGARWPRLGEIPVLIEQPEAHLRVWRLQLVVLENQARATLAALATAPSLSGAAATSTSADPLPATLARLAAMADAVHGQTRDVAQVLDPLLPPATPELLRTNVPPSLQSLVHHVHYLYRDWAWEQVGHDENARTVAALAEVMDPAPLGRVLVLGAGACRLAYDLHTQHGATETVALDIDPLLLAVASIVLRGGEVWLTEAGVSVPDLETVSTRWRLSAPAGAAATIGRLHLMVANALSPPFADGTFDTVVTPWFLDQVPGDLSTFLRNTRRLLVSGGRWLNVGPLLYPPATPLPARYGREELFELFARAGFTIQRWNGESRPYLVTPQNGRGKVEWTLAFEARVAT